MAAMSDGDILRKICNHAYTTPITQTMVNDALSPRPYEKRRAILDRLIGDDLIGWVHTYAGRVTAIEDFAGRRNMPDFGDAFISKDNTVTADRTQRAHTNGGSTSYLFLRNPAVGMSIADVEAAVLTTIAAAREQREADRRAHAESPVGKAERAISQAMRLEAHEVSVTAHETADKVSYFVNLSMLTKEQVDYLVMVTRAYPFGS